MNQKQLHHIWLVVQLSSVVASTDELFFDSKFEIGFGFPFVVGAAAHYEQIRLLQCSGIESSCCRCVDRWVVVAAAEVDAIVATSMEFHSELSCVHSC